MMVMMLNDGNNDVNYDNGSKKMIIIAMIIIIIIVMILMIAWYTGYTVVVIHVGKALTFLLLHPPSVSLLMIGLMIKIRIMIILTIIMII